MGKLGVEEGQTRQHARLLYLLGVEQIIVGINKMDACGWDEGRFTEIKDEFVKMLQVIGFKPKSKITGKTILDALNNFITPPIRYPDAPLRLPVSTVHNIKGVGQIICGTVEQGTLRPGDVIGITPSGLKNKKMFSIEQHKKVLESAGPGNSVGMSIKGVTKDEVISPGDIIYLEKEGECLPVKKFCAMFVVQEHPGILKPGYCPLIFSRTAKIACKMTRILWKQSKKTGNEKVDNPPHLSQFESAEVEFEPTQPLFLEPFEKCAALGRIAVMDSNRLKMLGKVTTTEN